ncbi:MAG: hypothetical protein QG602_3125, partial [Verrucomicrobiota bacterium]|nr:hypothetical protein [Verrucomicrobiota bacterium]
MPLSSLRLSLPFWLVAGLIGTLFGPSPAGGYTVEIKHQAKFSGIETYRSAAQKPDSNIAEAVSWASFTITEPVEVKVTVPEGQIREARILPSSRDIVVKIRDGAAHFTLRESGQFYLEINGESKHPLFIFADPLESNTPTANDPGVIYFGPGEHHLGDRFIEPRAGQIVYLAAGAVVHGRIKVIHAPNVTIRGRGILRGGHLPGNPPNTYTVPHAIEADQASTGVTIEGITIVESPHYQILLRGDDCV